jgi:hypothetical protein
MREHGDGFAPLLLVVGERTAKGRRHAQNAEQAGEKVNKSVMPRDDSQW